MQYILAVEQTDEEDLFEPLSARVRAGRNVTSSRGVTFESRQGDSSSSWKDARDGYVPHLDFGFSGALLDRAATLIEMKREYTECRTWS